MLNAKKFRVAVITSSDKGYRQERKDTSGPAIMEIMREQGYEILEYILVPDEKEMLTEAMQRLIEQGKCDLILTTGGTGFSHRDVTPEATKEIIERETPGISEAIRAYSMTITKRAMLSRGISGICRNTLIVNLPGSEKAVRESLNYIVDTLEHGLEILKGESGDCGRS